MKSLLLLLIFASAAVAEVPSQADAISYMLSFNRRLVDGDIQDYLQYVPDDGLVTIDFTKSGHPRSNVPKALVKQILEHANAIPEARKMGSGVALNRLRFKPTTAELEMSDISLIPLTTGETLIQRSQMIVVLEKHDGKVLIQRQEIVAVDDLGTLNHRL